MVKCNVPLRGWQSGIGGCPNVGGICMACTMPGFPDKYMPFMDEDPNGNASSNLARFTYGPLLRWGRKRSIKQQVRQGAGVAAQPRRAHHRLPEALVREHDMAIADTPATRRSSSRRCRGIRSPASSGRLGIHTEIDFTNQQVLKCYSTSMLFRGFDIFMKGIDPRDAHFITSRICGICGDNHCTCSCLNQNMAYGVKPPKLGDYAFNLAESADFMFDHAIFNDCMANVDYSEQMVKETNPSVLAKAEKTPAPHADIHGYKTIADIMRALNAFTGDFYLETLQVARYTREMYCLFGGRHTHPSTILPGGCSADITQQTLHGVLRAPDALHGLLQAHACPCTTTSTTSSTRRCRATSRSATGDTDLDLLGLRSTTRTYVDYNYANMTEWGRHAVRHARASCSTAS